MVFTRPSDLTEWFRAFLEIIAEEDRRYNREGIKQVLHLYRFSLCNISYSAGIALDKKN